MISGTAISSVSSNIEAEVLDIDLSLKYSAIVYSATPSIDAVFSEVAGTVESLDPLTISGTVVTIPSGYTLEVTLGQEVVIDTLLAIA